MIVTIKLFFKYFIENPKRFRNARSSREDTRDQDLFVDFESHERGRSQSSVEIDRTNIH